MLKKISFYFTTLFLAFSLIGSAYAVTLKASHQWPGTPRADGSFDPRHEMVQIIADEMKKANVGLTVCRANGVWGKFDKNVWPPWMRCRGC